MMRTKLAAIAVSGFAVSAICLGGAFALGGSALGDTILDIGDFGQPRCDTTGPSAVISRTLPWDGNGDRAAVAVAANTYYRAGSGDQLIVKGDSRIISHVYVRDGLVGIDCRTGGFFHNNAERIEVTLPGRNFRAFAQLGSGNMRLAALSQPDARISVEGSGSIEADGKIGRLKAVIEGSGNLQATGTADNLELSVEGSGGAKLGELVVKNASVSIAGSGDVEIAPQGASRVDIAGEGSGDVKAMGTADTLKVDVSGSGDMRLGGLSAKTAEVDIDGSGEVEIAPRDALRVGIEGSGDVTLRSEPKKLEASIAGSGHITHPDGTRQDRHSHDRHARLEREDFGAIVDEAAARGGPPDPDELDRATAKLKARIRHQVAQSLAGEDEP
ncbi:MAG: GIN domain-containing protein [Rhizomicrobium sp.]